MIENCSPALIIIVGALFLALFPRRLGQIWLVLLPVLSFCYLTNITPGETRTATFGTVPITPMVAGKINLLFGYLFHIAAIIAAIYSLCVKDRVQWCTGMLYAGSAIGVAFAGDLLTLFIFWELLAVTSVFQIWARKSARSGPSGIRYLLMHIASGLLLLGGAACQYSQTGSLAIQQMTLEGVGPWLIFLAIGIKCAFPFFHTWLVDSYPEATVTGAVFLSAFTTKAAVCILAQTFRGVDMLIIIGAVMAMFPIFFAVIENDLRRVLGYSMINQIGFMVVGIGIGTDLAVNGAVAHAFNDVLFKGLLFMSMGAVLYRTGKINGSELGGLYKSMPITMIFCIIGAASISAFPLFSGFVSKSLVMNAAAHEGHMVVWLLLLFAAAGVFHHAGIKIPFFAFFAHDSGIRCKEAPRNMLVAMAIAAALCIFNGTFPNTWLYPHLPHPVDAVDQPYTFTHIVTQTQLLFFSALAFVSLMLLKIYPPELVSTNLDVDWFYRKGFACFYRVMDKGLNGLNSFAHRWIVGGLVGRFSSFLGRAPSHIFYWPSLLFWTGKGNSQEDIQKLKNDLYTKTNLGSFPIGVSACLAILLMALICAMALFTWGNS